MIDWMIEVFTKLEIEEKNTLFLCINILDNYLSQVRE
jgi:hypothetical protein